ncbi:MAG: prepilin-type N-terminal cleavage/methylation domain-containing protein [Fuerstiella sp.]|jgi:general secretion pathway protein G
MKRRGDRSGFSLIELVVVVLIMGILAAVAAPKIFDKMSDARDSSTKQSIATIRGAIELYRVEEGGFPADPSVDLTDYIKGLFPKCEVIVDGNADVELKTGTSALAVDSSSTKSWLYNSTTGEMRINDAAYITY